MPRPLAEELNDIETIVRARPRISSAEIEDALPKKVARRTLQYRLKRLVDDGRLIREGGDRAARYHTPEAAAAPASPEAAETEETAVTLSHDGEEIRAHVRQPVTA